jgi:hypothetical protein
MSADRTLLFNRLEVKYLVDRSTRTALAQDLAAFMRPDIHAGPEGAYMVRSLYFDTPDYRAYSEKTDGVAVWLCGINCGYVLTVKTQARRRTCAWKSSHAI